MARRAAAETTKSRSKSPHMVAWGVAGLLAATAIVVSVSQLEQFVISDPRFALGGSAESGHRSGYFRVTGNYYTTEAEIAKVFKPDFGRSVYRCPHLPAPPAVAGRRLGGRSDRLPHLAEPSVGGDPGAQAGGVREGRRA